MHELDWSVAALFDGISADPRPSVTANLIFAIVAYSLLVVQMAFLLSFFGLLIGLSAVLSQISDEDRELRLTPDARTQDRRRGFQIFAPFFLGVLSVSLLAYLACYLMRVQNLFLRDGEYRRIDQLLFDYMADSLRDRIDLPHDARSLFQTVAQSILDISNAVFSTGDLADTQSYLGIGMILIGVLLVVLALFVILRSAAEESRQRVERELQDPQRRGMIESYYGAPADVLLTRIGPGGMDEWPLKWPRLNSFLAYMALGLACFFFYRLALLWLALQLWQLLRKWPKN